VALRRFALHQKLAQWYAVAMVRKALAILLAVSWIVLSDVDMLEDLDFESRSTPSASSSPSTAKTVKLANDRVELASRTFETLFRSTDLEGNTWANLAALSLETGALRSHKDNCVLLI
jgi:hypothetical protein